MVVLGMTILAALTIVVTVAMLARAVNRRRRAYAVLRYVKTAVDAGMPLEDVIGNAALTERRKIGKRLRDLFVHLDDGQPLAYALDAVPEVGKRDKRLIEVGEQQGRLPDVLDRVVGRIGWETEPSRGKTWDAVDWMYPLLVVAAGLLMAVPFLVMIGHVLEYGAEDLGAGLPWGLHGLVEVAPGMTYGYYMDWFLVVAVLIVAGVIGWPVWRMLEPARWLGSMSKSVCDLVIWWLPIVGGLARDAAYADAFYAIGLVVEDGEPLDEAVQRTVDASGNAMLRRRLRAWERRLSDGEAIGASARAVGLDELAATMMENGVRSGGLAETLKFLSRYYQDRRARTYAMARATVLPVLTLVAAVVIGAMAYLLIKSSSLMIEHLVQEVDW